MVTFTCIQGPEVHLTEFVRYLEAYLPSFRQLSEFRFLYLARVELQFEKPKELFNSLVVIPLGFDASADLLRYFQVRVAWDLGRYTSITEADLIYRNQAKTRFVGQRFEHLYRGWKVGRITQADIRQEFGGGNQQAVMHFASEVLCRFAPTSGKRVQRVRSTHSTLAFTFLFTLWRKQFLGLVGDRERSERESHREKKFKSGAANRAGSFFHGDREFG